MKALACCAYRTSAPGSRMGAAVLAVRTSMAFLRHLHPVCSLPCFGAGGKQQALLHLEEPHTGMGA